MNNVDWLFRPETFYIVYGGAALFFIGLLTKVHIKHKREDKVYRVSEKQKNS